MIDIHSHLLPGLDDGPADIATTIQMARMALADGISTVICTPHYDVAHPLPPAELDEWVQRTRQLLESEGLYLCLLAGAELPLIPELPELAAAGALPTLGGQGRYLLIELPFFGIPTFADQTFFELQVAGFQPIIAHPERSELARRNLPKLLEMADRGIPMQINCASVLGHDGRPARKLALRLIREGAATFLATDAHNASSRPPQLSTCRRALGRLREPGLFERLTELNPSRLL